MAEEAHQTSSDPRAVPAEAARPLVSLHAVLADRGGARTSFGSVLCAVGTSGKGFSGRGSGTGVGAKLFGGSLVSGDSTWALTTRRTSRQSGVHAR